MAIQLALNISLHTAERMKEREITPKMIRIALYKGIRYWDPTHRIINYVIHEGFASGNCLLVGQNPLTGRITTVIRLRKISSRFILLKEA